MQMSFYKERGIFICYCALQSQFGSQGLRPEGGY